MISKALSETGEWVEGFYWEVGPEGAKSCFIRTEIPYGDDGVQIADVAVKHGTNCEKVGTTEIFNGDEVNYYNRTGFVEYAENQHCYIVNYGTGNSWAYLYTNDWKPTGRNKHDLESERS